jgi:hypothetical protein
LKSIGEAIVEKVTYFPLEKASYSFSGEQLQTFGNEEQKEPFCHRLHEQKFFSYFQKGAWIVCHLEKQWKCMTVEQINWPAKLESEWRASYKKKEDLTPIEKEQLETKTLQWQKKLNKKEEDFTPAEKVQLAEEVNFKMLQWQKKLLGSQSFYTFRGGNTVITMSFDDVEANIDADEIRPLVSAGAQLPAAWFDTQWEKTSNTQCDLCNETMKAASSFVLQLKESSAHVTVRQTSLFCFKAFNRHNNPPFKLI